MKTFKNCLAACVSVILSLCAASLQAAVINYVGTQTDLGPHWRISSTAKPLDIDNNNVLGADGYDVINLTAVLPGYVSQMTILSSTTGGDAAYASIDNPTSLPATFQTGTMNLGPGPGASADLFNFTLNSGVTGRRIRVGLLVDNLDNAIYNAASLTLVQTSGTGAAIASVATTSGLFNDRVPDWIFFDITGAAAGDTFVIRGVGGPAGYATLGGVAFDSSTRSPFVITDLSDSGGPGTLRGAIDSLVANDLVQFSPSLSGQAITLTNGEIVLDQNVTIDASGLSGGIQINGNHASRIFEVFTNVTATLNSLTVINGSAPAGGGIMNNGTLTLNDCSLAGNAVTSGGGGGGIYNNLGTLTLNQCTVGGNSATAGNGAGGGIFNLSTGAPVTLNQCTVSGNSAGTGGGFASFNYIGNNNVTLFNSIVAGNSAATGPDLDAATTPFLFGNNLTSGNPFLAAPGNYGGPTPTMPPLSGSPAIDAGSDAALNVPYNFTADQRGLPRLIGTHVDIGAAEAKLAVVVTTNADSGPGSLRAVMAANPGGIITFAPNLSGQTILLTSGQIMLTNSLSIDASMLPGGLIISGNQASRIFAIYNSPVVILNSLSLVNAYADATQGGAIYSTGMLTIRNCTFSGDLVGGGDSYGGAIFNGGAAGAHKFHPFQQCGK